MDKNDKDKKYVVYYTNAPVFKDGFDEALRNGWSARINHIVAFSPDIEKIKMLVQTNKYNI